MKKIKDVIWAIIWLGLVSFFMSWGLYDFSGKNNVELATNTTQLGSTAAELPTKPDTTIIVTATCYNATSAQCNTTYWKTADGSTIDLRHPNKHRWCAVSQNLLKTYNYGDTILVSGTWVYDGLWIIHDTMNKRYNNYIDFLVHRNMYINKWKNIKIVKYGKQLERK